MNQTFEREVVFDSCVIFDFKAGRIKKDIFLSHIVSVHSMVYKKELKHRKLSGPALKRQKI